MFNKLFISFYFCLKLFYLYFMILVFGIDKNIKNIVDFINFGGVVFIKISQNLAYKNNIKGVLKQEILKFGNKNIFHPFNLPKLPFLFKFIKKDEPLAVGSVAVVWKGMWCKKHVIIKIIKPNIRAEIKRSIYLFNIFLFFSNLIYKNNQLFGCFEKEYLYQQLYTSINLKNEYNNILKFKLLNNNFEDYIIIPTVYYYSDTILIESYHSGFNMENIITKYSDKLEQVVNLIQAVFYKMFFENLLHADLHPNNFLIKFVNDKPKIVLLDFGLVEKFNNKFFKQLLYLFQKNIFFPDLYKLIILLANINLNFNVKTDNFVNESNNYLIKINYLQQINKMLYNDNQIKLIPFNCIITKILSIAAKNKIIFPGNILILLNTFILIDDYRSIFYGNRISWKQRLNYIKSTPFYLNYRTNIIKIING